MNPRDELIRRAMFHARHGYAVGGKPGESAMSRAEAERGVSSGNYGGQTARAEAGSIGGGGGNAAGNNGGINRTTTRNEMRTSIFDPDKASARLGPNAAQAMAGAGVDPDRAIVAAQNINRSGVPASGNMLTQRAPLMDRSLQDVLNYNPQPTVQQTPPTNYNRSLNAQVTPTGLPIGFNSLGNLPSMGDYQQMSLDNAIAMSRALAAPNDVMQYGMPVEAGVVRDLPGAERNKGKRQHAGVDFEAPTGTAVTPSMPGTVVQVSKASGYGPTIDVQDIYGNIQRYAVHDTGTVNTSVGSYVAPGDTIGTVGAQLVKDPFEHLHFENISPKDQAYNDIMSRYAADPAFGATPNFKKFENTSGKLNPDLPRISGLTKSPAGGPILSSTEDWVKATGVKSYSPVSANVGTPSSLAQSFNPNQAPTALAAGPQSIVGSGYYDQTTASAFPEFDRLATVVNSPAGFTSPNMGQLAAAPPQMASYNRPPADAAYMAAIAPDMAAYSRPPADAAYMAPSPAQLAQAPINLPRPRPDNLAQLAQAQIPLPQPRPANLTQTAQAPVTLPRPRPANLSPLDQALQIASNVNNFKPFADNISRDISRDNKSDREDRKGKDDKGNKKGSLSEADEKALTDKGYTKKQIEKMTQKEIDAILRPENVAGVAPPVTPVSPPVVTEPEVPPVVTAARGGRMGYAEGGRGREERETSEERGGGNKKDKDVLPAIVDNQYGPAMLPGLPDFRPILPPTYSMPQASPSVANFVNSIQQPSFMMSPAVNPMVSAPMTPTQPAQNNQYQNYLNPFGSLYGYANYFGNPGYQMNQGGSVNGSNNSIDNAMRIIRG